MLRDVLVAFCGSALAAYPIYRILLALKSRQTVSQYAPETHQKKQGTPTMGGLIIIFGFVLIPLIHLGESGFQNQGILLLTLGFTLIGFTDDFLVPRMFPGKRGLGWKQKILMQIVVAAAAAGLLYGDFSVPSLLAIFLILFFSNAYNFSDGLDWLAGTLLVGLCFGLMALAKETRQDGLNLYLLTLIAAALPFLFLNRPKAKIFMGDVGSLPIGAFLGLAVAQILCPRTGPGLHFSSVPGFPQSANLGSAAQWPLRTLCVLVVSGMMIVELVPVPLQILSVKLRKKKLFSFTPVHHAFERKGWPETKVVAVFAGCQIALSLLAWLMASLGTKALGSTPVAIVSRTALARSERTLSVER